MSGKTLVIGASVKQERYSNKAIRLLRSKGYPVLALGRRVGEVEDVAIDVGKPDYDDVHTVTMYVGPQHQAEFEDYIKSLNPERVIFNPGTENSDFESRLHDAGIATEQACTLVMLNLGVY